MGLGLSVPVRAELLSIIRLRSANFSQSSTAASHYIAAVDQLHIAAAAQIEANLSLRATLKIQAVSRGFLQRLRYHEFVRGVLRQGTALSSNPRATMTSSHGDGLLAPLRDWMNLESRYVSALEVLSKTWVPLLLPLEIWPHTVDGPLFLSALKSLPMTYEAHMQAFSSLMDAIPTLSVIEANPLDAMEQRLRVVSHLVAQRRDLCLIQREFCRHAHTIRRILERIRAVNMEVDVLLRSGGSLSLSRSQMDTNNPIRSLDVLDLLLEPFNFLPRLRLAMDPIVSGCLSSALPYFSRPLLSELASCWGAFVCVVTTAASHGRPPTLVESGSSMVFVAAGHNPFSEAVSVQMTLNSSQIIVTPLNLAAGSSPASSTTALAADCAAATLEATNTLASPRAILTEDQLLLFMSGAAQPFFQACLDVVVLQTDPLPAASGASLCVWGLHKANASRINCVLLSFAKQSCRVDFLAAFTRCRDIYCSRNAAASPHIESLLEALQTSIEPLADSRLHRLLASPPLDRRIPVDAPVQVLWELLLVSLMNLPDPVLPGRMLPALRRWAEKDAAALTPVQALSLCSAVPARLRSILTVIVSLVRREWFNRQGTSLHVLAAFIAPWLFQFGLIERHADHLTAMGVSGWLKQLVHAAPTAPDLTVPKDTERMSEFLSGPSSVAIEPPAIVHNSSTETIIPDGAVEFRLTDFRRLHAHLERLRSIVPVR